VAAPANKKKEIEISKISNLFFTSEDRRNIIQEAKEHKKSNNYLTNNFRITHQQKDSKNSSLKVILFSAFANFLNEENTLFLQELALVFFYAMLSLEENFPDYKYKKSKIMIYLDEIEFNLFELFFFLEKVKEKILFVDLIIMNAENIIFKLDTCMNQIYFPDNFISKKGIGLLPIKQSVISTKGLKWNIGKKFFCNYCILFV